MALPAASSNTASPKPNRITPGLRLPAGLFAALLLSATPAVAQQRSPEERLDTLIPQEAVENPEDWANAATDALPSPPEPDAVPEIGDDGEAVEVEELPIDPATPLDEVPGITIAWPDEDELPAFVSLEEQADALIGESEIALLAGQDGGYEMKISDKVTLLVPEDLSAFPVREEFARRFAQLSTLVLLDGDDDQRAQVAARAEEDQDLLERLLRNYGYYRGQVIRTLSAPAAGDEAEPDQARTRFEILPDTQYRFGTVDLGELEQTGADYEGFREEFAIESGDPLLQDRIVDQREALAVALGENGYPFAAIRNPRLLVDHDRSEGDLTLPTEPGGKYRFGQVHSSLPDFLSGEHLGDIARFEPGDIYRTSEELDLRQAILATGLVGSVGVVAREVEPPRDGEPGVVDLDVELTKAPQRTLRGAIGYGTGEGVRIEGSWEHRNLFPPEGLLRVRGIAGTQEQLVGVTYRRNNVSGRDRVMTLDLYATSQESDAYDEDTIAFSGTYELLSTILFQKPLSWSGGVELIATRQREMITRDLKGPSTEYLIAAFPVRALYDTSDSLLDPTRGLRIGGRISPEYSRRSGTEAFYVNTQFDLSYYNQVSDKVVLAARTRVASILGAGIADIAPSRRLYAGGGASVRGFGYQAIGPRDGLGEPNGGRSLVEASLEARIRTGLMGGAIALVPFIDAGAVDQSSTPSFDDIKVGAGVGIRYYTSFGPMRIDIATPLNPGPDDSWIGVYVSLGQAF